MSNTLTFEGTVSEGTMREEDLIPRFLSVLAVLDKDRAESLIEEYKAEGFDYEDMVTDEYGTHYPFGQDDDRTYNLANEMTHALFDLLGEHAPEGYYFGAHPGDGADYGFWAVEED